MHTFRWNGGILFAVGGHGSHLDVSPLSNTNPEPTHIHVFNSEINF